MDPLALAAVVGLVYAGKRISDTTDATRASEIPKVAIIDQIPQGSRQTYHLNSNDMGIQGSVMNDPFPGVPARKREISGTFADMSGMANRNPYGQPVYNLYNRQAVTNKMYNFPPIERKNIGPGIGVGPNVAATGGFQQFFRVLPTNVNEERLVQLEGRAGPPSAVVPSGWVQQGGLTQTQRPPKIYYRAPGKGIVQGQGGALSAPEHRPMYQRTQYPSIKSQTVSRGDDGLGFGTQYFRKDGGYENPQNALRGNDNRAKKSRVLPGGNMNVRADPLNAYGASTAVRRDTMSIPMGPPDGGRMGNYTKPSYDKFNGYKGNANPWACKLDIAQTQLANNPLAKSIAAV